MKVKALTEGQHLRNLDFRSLSFSAISVLHQERLDPVVMPALAYPISDRVDFQGHLEPLPEGLGEPLQCWPGKSPDRFTQLVDGG
jgi:hypothetical protein